MRQKFLMSAISVNYTNEDDKRIQGGTDWITSTHFDRGRLKKNQLMLEIFKRIKQNNSTMNDDLVRQFANFKYDKVSML